MIIDDSEIDIFIATHHIRSNNAAAQIKTFNSSLEAIEYFREIKDEKDIACSFIPEIILLDINMPHMNGFQFLDEFYKFKTFSSVKICFVSSTRNKEDMERIKRHEHCTFIPKPLSRELLLKHLDE